MTPLEELQAAHKRLSGLKAATGGSWHAQYETLYAGPHRVAQGVFAIDMDLMLTLHRTIDAQLEILQEGIRDVVAACGLSTDWRVHDLASAINGETS